MTINNTIKTTLTVSAVALGAVFAGGAAVQTDYVQAIVNPKVDPLTLPAGDVGHDMLDREVAMEKVEASNKAYEAEQARKKAAEAAARAKERERLEQLQNSDPRAFAQAYMADQYGWGGDQFGCLNSLWNKESGWNFTATNPSSGAYGIPQSLPGSKMAAAGSDWQTNPQTQIKWGLSYISASYGTPCAAWGHSQATNWY